MHEPQRAGGCEDAAGAQGVGGLGGPLIVELGEYRDVPEQRAVADDRHGRREPLRGRREAAEPGPHRRDHAVRRGAQGLLGAGVAHRVRELAEEERVPAGQLVAGATQRLRRLRDGRADETRGRVLAERVRTQRRVAQQVGDGHAARLAGPCGHDEQHRHLAQPVREVGEEPQRCGVGPVRVVDQ